MRLSGTKRSLLGIGTGKYLSTFTSTTAGSFTVNAPIGAVTAVITFVGSGGAGGSADTNGAGGGGEGATATKTVIVQGGASYPYTLASGSASFWGLTGSRLFGANTGANGTTDPGGIGPHVNPGGAGGTPFGAFSVGTTGATGSPNSGLQLGGDGGGINGGAGGLVSSNGSPASGVGGGGGGAGGPGLHSGGARGAPQITIQWYSH